MKTKTMNRDKCVYILDEIQTKFGGVSQWTDDDEMFAISDCNGFESIFIRDEGIDDNSYYIEMNEVVKEYSEQIWMYVNDLMKSYKY